MEVVVTMSDPLARQLAEDAVIERYRTGRLSQRQVGEVLTLNYWQTETFLAQRGVPINYSASDLEADDATLGKILHRS